MGRCATLAGAREERRRKIRSLQERQDLLKEAGQAFFQGVDALDFLEEWAEAFTAAAAAPLGGAVALYADTPPVLSSHPVLSSGAHRVPVARRWRRHLLLGMSSARK